MAKSKDIDTAVKRKAISNTLRFEIFKRDLFTCQYCGKKAPDVVLNVDHIIPVKKRGQNDILNLITSCFECNNGKRDKELSDTSLIDKQRTQIEELQERKTQISMLLDWKMGLSKLSDHEADRVIEYCNSKSSGFILSEHGEKGMRGLIKKYGAEKVVSAIDESFEKYYAGTENADNYHYTITQIKNILFFHSLPPDKQAERLEIRKILSMCHARLRSYDYLPASSWSTPI